MRRRQAIGLTISAATMPLFADCVAADWEQVLRDSLKSNNALTLGHIVPPPDDPAWREVDQILESSPKSPTTPIRVAQYLLGAVPTKYKRAWPEPNPAQPTYANPLILRLFLSTHTVPSGDTTAWCAAFVNWCLQRAGIDGTSSASSQSFANWGQEVWKRGTSLSTAKSGDIAVFRRQSDPAHGHVGFFCGVSAALADQVDILGGNQLEGAVGIQQHLIEIQPLRIDGNTQLISIRRKQGLQNS